MAFAPLMAELGLGAAFTMIALAPMVPEWVKKPEGPKMNVKILAGSPDDNSDNTFGGAVPQIALFDVNGERLGYWRNEGGKELLGKGNTADKQVGYIKEKDNRKPEYITLTASGFEGICITSVVVFHPESSDTFAFLPGEIAAQCESVWDEHDGESLLWSNQVTNIQFQSPAGKKGTARPKCLWIDSPDENGKTTTKWKGLGTHLPDFKLDNSTYKEWERDPFQMCGSKARFGLYEKINEMMCPPVFDKAPMEGARIPMSEFPTCAPGLFPDANGNVQEDLCKDPAVHGAERKTLSDAFGLNCENFDDEDGDLHGQCPRHIRQRDPVACNGRRRSEPSRKKKENLQNRFLGKLVKSYDIRQSARELCNSKGSVGPNFYSYHEKQFCDMGKKKLFSLCEDDGQVECFDGLLNTTRHSPTKGNRSVTHDSVQDWR
ncbi:hypothetical protein P171DRAFT_478182 [Karstenula rhodostoma CBS 690.94]|uniref:Uncharacterized protein n=1 Tax=Karstenula rhodostoma CBS 690.94 TaxID=1392251 RepID=A0A9P4U5P3_9PLEO|nr:hypothetical protein P171DRAFT_478182 [Karstenula rhodostoma CBS 690.94]